MSHKLYAALTLATATILSSTCFGQANSSNTPAKEINTAVMPVARTNAWWMQRHEQVLKRVAQGNVGMIFVGDSITHYWESRGKTVWNRYYAPRHAVNLGFSGDKTENVLWRLEHGEVAGIHPKLAVVMIGTNNRNSANEIADGIKAIVEQLRARLPETKILVLAIFPRGSYEDRKDPKILESGRNTLWNTDAEASRIVSKMADNKMIYYLDIGDAFLKNGKVQRKYMPDFLHPNTQGYQVWAQAMEPTIKELMDKK